MMRGIGIAAWVALAAAWAWLAWRDIEPGRRASAPPTKPEEITHIEGFQPPIQPWEIDHITYEHWVGGDPPLNHEVVDVYVHREWSRPVTSGLSGTACIRVARYKTGLIVTSKGDLECPEPTVTKWSRPLTQDQLASLATLLTGARVWELSRWWETEWPEQRWSVAVLVFRDRAGGSPTHLRDLWRFDAGVAGDLGPQSVPGFADLVAEFDAMTRQPPPKGK